MEENYGASLYKYRDVFPGKLPAWAPPDWKLGDMYEIALVEKAAPTRKSMYRHSP